VSELYEPNDGVFEDDLSIELWQDDGESTYWCSPEYCAYDGDDVCSNCGFARDED
jgi:hypothetical protein